MGSPSKPTRRLVQSTTIPPSCHCHPSRLASSPFPVISEITARKQTPTAERYYSHFYESYVLVLCNTLAAQQRILLQLFFPESRLGFTPRWSKKYSHDAEVMGWAGKARATFRLPKDNPRRVGKAFRAGMFAIGTKRWGTGENQALYWSKQESGKSFLPLRDDTTTIKWQIRHSNMSESDMFPSTAFCRIKVQAIWWCSMYKAAEINYF